jgi:hypothetical protein
MFATAMIGKELRSHIQQRRIKIEFGSRAPPNTNREAQASGAASMS